MKRYLSLFLPIIVFLVVVPLLKSAWAANLKFDKTTVSTTNGGTFTISVIVDPSPDAVFSTDVYVNYDATALKANSVAAGSLFPTVTNDISTSGKVYIAGLVNDPASSITAAGTLATITFQALKEATVTLSFDCATSKVIKNDINATNVLNCSQNGTSTVTIGAGGSSVNPTATPVPLSGNESDAGGEDIPQELPQSGELDNLIKFAISGIFLLILGSTLRFVL